jgi:tetratricopeptide (TPR) repeat protein
MNRRALYWVISLGTFFLISAQIPVLSFSAEGYFSIQTGHFQELKNAEKQFDWLQKRLSDGDAHFLRIEKTGDYFVVRIGRFDSISDEAGLLESVKSLVPKAWVVRSKGAETIVKLADNQDTEELYRQDTLKESLVEISKQINDGDYSYAQKLIENGIERWPEEHEFLGLYGIVLLKTNKPKKALQYFYRAASLSHEIPDYYNGAGYSMLYMDRPQQAIDEFERALKINPEFIDSLTGIGFAYIHIGRKDDALDVYRKLKKLDNEAGDVLFKMIMTE